MAGLGVGELAALAVAGAGTAASISAQRRQEKQQRATLNRQMERTEQATDKAVDLVQQEGQRFSPEARAAQMAEAEAAAAASAEKDLGAGGPLVSTAGDAGNVSAEFLTEKADRAISEGTRLTALGRELAKIRAPGQLQQNDRLSQANLASSLSNIGGTNANMARANSMDAAAIQAPAYGQLGQIASALGGAYLASGAGRSSLSNGGQIAWDGPAVGTSTMSGATGGAQLARGGPAIGFGRR